MAKKVMTKPKSGLSATYKCLYRQSGTKSAKYPDHPKQTSKPKV